MSAVANNLPNWRGRGFADPPIRHVTQGGEELARAFSRNPFHDAAGGRHGSFERGNCFFVCSTLSPGHPIAKIARSKIFSLDVYALEEELNAALWNNTFQEIAVFTVPSRLRIAYWLGYVGFNIETLERLDTSTGKVFSRATMEGDRPSRRNFMQVVLEDPKDLALLHLACRYPVRDAYRYLGVRSPMWN